MDLFIKLFLRKPQNSSNRVSINTSVRKIDNTKCLNSKKLEMFYVIYGRFKKNFILIRFPDLNETVLSLNQLTVIL